MPNDNNTEAEALTVDDIKAMLGGVSDAILEQVDNRFKSLNSQQPSESTDEATQPSGTLSQRIAQLEGELRRRDEEKAKTEQQQRYDTTFNEQLSQYDLAYNKETAELLHGVFASKVKEVDGKWLSQDGKTLNELVDGFFKTPFGQHLLKAPNNQPGSGTTSTSNPRQAPTGEASAVARLFGLA